MTLATRTRYRAVCVLREAVFSPGMVEHDAAILRATAAELESRHGVSSRVVGVGDLPELGFVPDLILSMADGDDALARLAGFERDGTIVLNATAAIRATRRAALLALSRPVGPLVEGAMVACTALAADVPQHLLATGSGGVKRGDYHALGTGDVTRVSVDQIVPQLRSLHARGVATAVVQPHLAGPIVKFYAVDVGRACEPTQGHPTRFFRTFVTSEGATPGAATLERLQNDAFRAADMAGLTVFGGDAVVTASGEPVIIDLNAWPSFWRCLADAGRAIASHAATRLARSPARARVGSERA